MTTDETTGSKNIGIRLISQKTFDELGDDRKLFYLDLIKKGQVKISEDTEKPKDRISAKPAAREEGRDPFSWLRDKNVQVTLTTGDLLTGLLTDVWQYEIAIKPSDGNSLLILKHAVMIVQEI
jgi:sRNA-binding regulator protein Hfq